jgi:hypothetical protein
MSPFSKMTIALKALRQLGFQQVSLNALYKFGLITGHYRRVTDDGPRTVDRGQSSAVCRPLFDLPTRSDILAILGTDGQSSLLAEADEIVSGKVRLFGANPVPLQLTFSEPLHHWSVYETNPALLTPLYSLISDIKFLWEPARFGWAFTLGRAYVVSGNEKYAEAFWKYFETFTDALDERTGSRAPSHGIRLGGTGFCGITGLNRGAKVAAGSLSCCTRGPHPAHACVRAVPAQQPSAHRSRRSAHRGSCFT